MGRYFRYWQRDQHLKEDGYESYQDYLASDVWLNLKALVLAQTPECEVCKEPSEAVHHVSYKRHFALCKKPTKHLASLCKSCHYKVEFHNGEKLGLYEALTKLTVMLTWAESYERAEQIAVMMGRRYRISWFKRTFENAMDGVRARSQPGMDGKWSGSKNKRRKKRKSK